MAAVRYALEDFVHDMEDLLGSQPTGEGIFDKGSDCLSRLIANPDAIPERFRLPVGAGSRSNHGSWLLHHSPDSGLLVTAVVWGPRRSRRSARSSHLGHDRRDGQRPHRDPFPARR